MKIAIISTYPPQKCGIATFAKDLYTAMQMASDENIHIIAVSDGREENYPIEVSYIIDKHDYQSYQAAADFINNQYDICVIQHEYGIFGGESGAHILGLCRRLHIPLVSNFHTISPKPSDRERTILFQLGLMSHSITVMTDWAVNILQCVYKLSPEKIRVIPHGVPTFDYQQEKAKRKLGLSGKKVLLSFGLLGRGKGFETAIDAVKAVDDQDFVYIILGMTHPNVLKEEGEAYRYELIERCRQAQVENKVLFINEFADDDLLCSYLSACDMYVTPYPNENQISSGTLSFALGAGAAVISTPYIYARDLLAAERGLFFDFGNSAQLGAIINELLQNPNLLSSYRENARRHGESMCWSNVGKRYYNLLSEMVLQHKPLFKRA